MHRYYLSQSQTDRCFVIVELETCGPSVANARMKRAVVTKGPNYNAAESNGLVSGMYVYPSGKCCHGFL